MEPLAEGPPGAEAVFEAEALFWGGDFVVKEPVVAVARRRQLPTTKEREACLTSVLYLVLMFPCFLILFPRFQQRFHRNLDFPAATAFPFAQHLLPLLCIRPLKALLPCDISDDPSTEPFSRNFFREG